MMAEVEMRLAKPRKLAAPLMPEFDEQEAVALLVVAEYSPLSEPRSWPNTGWPG